MMKLLLHPRFFDILILVLFACAFLRWALFGHAGRALYWGSAFLLNVSVIFMMREGE